MRRFLQHVDESRFLGERATRSVNQPSTRFHQLEFGRAHSPCDEYSVLQTVMPRCLAASRSIEALRGQLETTRRKRPSCPRVACLRGVRSRITQTTSKGSRRAMTAAGSTRWSLNTVTSAPAFEDRPVGHRERDILVIVKDSDFNQRLRGH
jgi:hypothetical protein